MRRAILFWGDRGRRALCLLKPHVGTQVLFLAQRRRGAEGTLRSQPQQVSGAGVSHFWYALFLFFGSGLLLCLRASAPLREACFYLIYSAAGV